MIRPRLAATAVPSDSSLAVYSTYTAYTTSAGSQTSPAAFASAFHYVVQHVDNDFASFGFLGGGCAGALGIPELQAVPGSQLVLGQTFTLEVNRLPLSACILIIGFDNTASPSLGPLPVPIPVMPGCTLRVADHIIDTMFGAGNVANWTLAIPATTALLGLQLFHQALVPSPGANPLDFVFSDATGGVVGL